tara:strand:+ start:102 stop:410 length:309 start_codon:yes stop_codon:yes gene_type:complete
MADALSRLPVDSTIPNHDEISMVNELFKKHGSTMDKVIDEFRSPIIYTLIFIVLSLPISTRAVNYLFPSILNEDGNLFTILAKAIVFIILVYVVQNYTHVKK